MFFKKKSRRLTTPNENLENTKPVLEENSENLAVEDATEVKELDEQDVQPTANYPTLFGKLMRHQRLSEPEPTESETVVETEEAEQQPQMSSLGRLFKSQQTPFSGPENSYENESWAPEIESVGLFRKNRAIAEEQLSSTSGPQ